MTGSGRSSRVSCRAQVADALATPNFGDLERTRAGMAHCKQYAGSKGARSVSRQQNSAYMNEISTVMGIKTNIVVSTPDVCDNGRVHCIHCP